MLPPKVHRRPRQRGGRHAVQQPVCQAHTATYLAGLIGIWHNFRSILSEDVGRPAICGACQALPTKWLVNGNHTGIQTAHVVC